MAAAPKAVGAVATAAAAAAEDLKQVLPHQAVEEGAAVDTEGVGALAAQPWKRMRRRRRRKRRMTQS